MQSIGDFAESLILNEVKSVKTGDAMPPIPGAPKAAPEVPDISRVKVPASFMSQVLGESVQEEVVEPEVIEPEEVIEEEETQPSYLTEDTASELITLLKEVKSMLSEMTTTGMLGVNLAGPTKKPKSKKDDLQKRLDKIRARRR